MIYLMTSLKSEVRRTLRKRMESYHLGMTSSSQENNYHQTNLSKL